MRQQEEEASRQSNAKAAPKFSQENRFGDGGRGGWLGRTAYAALDLGTNNCRLLIARASNDGFTVVDAFSRVVRLGEGLATTGKMSEEAMDRAIEALSVCADKLKRRNVDISRARSRPRPAGRR
jgi:exopolyphosphatase/guanosine-5'-triphosphate,3'-diphosphate pyrophosphatase